MTLSRTTRDHNEIRKWAEARGAVPAEVRGTEKGGEPGILRFEFPDAPNRNDDKLQRISWEDFFKKFDERGLELVFQETTADGARSNFNKLVRPENAKSSHRDSEQSSVSHKSHSGSSHSSSGSQSEQESGKSSTKKHKAA